MTVKLVSLLIAILFSVAAEAAPEWAVESGPSRMGGYKSMYTRSAEVQERCNGVLGNIASDLSSVLKNGDDGKKWAIQNELSFQNGDWQQEKGEAPLMPYISKRPLNDSSSLAEPQIDPSHLVSFWITDVDLQSGGSLINISAVLQLGISTERMLSFMGGGFEEFQMYPGLSLLTIVMEGVYAETSNSERVLCMLGRSKLPSRSKNASDPWDWTKPSLSSSSFSPPLSEDSNIIAHFRFPQHFSLTSRAVHGRLRSLHAPITTGYFNPVDLSSQLGAYSSYEFVAGDLVKDACANPALPEGVPVATPTEVYRGDRFCAVVMELLSGQWIDVLPNWKCSTSKDVCTSLGPFSVEKEDGSFNGTQLVMQDIRCVDAMDNKSANMSAVIRAVTPLQNHNTAQERTALNELTLAVEGTWSNASGQLCMVGCRGSFHSDAGNDDKACDTHVSIYIPLSFSLKQRSMVSGSISLAYNSSNPFYPLSFQLHLHSPPRLPWAVLKQMRYIYSKINVAGSILERDEPVGFGEQIKRSLMKYPSLKPVQSKQSYTALREDLSIHSLCITNPRTQKGPHIRQYFNIDVMAIEEYVELDWQQETAMAPAVSFEEIPNELSREQKEFVRVAAELKIQDMQGLTTFSLSAEGEYDPTLGRMYTVGCREAHLPWEVFHENAELLEDGLDCMIEMKVEYPPTNVRWLMNPTVMLTVASTRTEDDPLFFPKIELETFPILYKKQREEILSQKNLEGVLSILTLSLIMGCIASQLMYLRSHTESIPYISLLALGIQAIGYSIPLITGVEALFARMTSKTEDMRTSVLNDGKTTQLIGYMVKLLTLIAFLLTLRIVQKVYKSRIRLATRRPLELWRVPSERRVLVICSIVHIFVFLIVLIVHTVGNIEHPINSSMFMDWKGNLHKQHDWERELQEYFGLVQDLFLLPQVVGNHLWQVRGKPLRKLFYIGITILRLLPHVYDSLRSPLFNPYFADEFQYANPSSDFYSKVGDITIPLLAVLLSIIVYIQQRWNGVKWSKVLKSGSSKLMRMGSRMYERLPSQNFEAEMVESVTTSHAPENGHASLTDEH